MQTGKMILLQQDEFKQPLIPKYRKFGDFSVELGRIYNSMKKELKFYKMPRKEAINLTINMPSTLPVQPDEPYADYLDNMLYFIRDNPDVMINRTRLMQPVVADIVTQHMVLQTLLCTLYSKLNWRVLGTRYRNTVYLCLAQPEDPGTNSLESQKLQTCKSLQGKLEQIIFSETPDNPTTFRTDGGKFYGVFGGHIDELSVAYSSLLGCSNGEQNQIMEHFKECKALLTNNGGNAKPSIEQSVIWWSDCMLKDINKFHVAHFDDSDCVSNIKVQLTSRVLSKSVMLNCIRFMSHTLHRMRDTMQIDDPNVVYQFDYAAEPGILSYTACDERSERTFISDWYRNMFN